MSSTEPSKPSGDAAPEWTKGDELLGRIFIFNQTQPKVTSPRYREGWDWDSFNGYTPSEAMCRDFGRTSDNCKPPKSIIRTGRGIAIISKKTKGKKN